MNPQPFTPQGVQSMMQQLYGLSEAELKTQSEQALTDFKSWVRQRFQLDTMQLGYLNNLKEDWLKLAASQVSFALAYRVPITLSGPSGQTASKLIRFLPPVVTGGEGSITIDGGLRFIIEYR